MAELAAEAFAKVNFGLTVSSRGSDGYHPVVSLVQSVSWSDRIELVQAGEDRLVVEGMHRSEDNLAWRALQAVRSAAGSAAPMSLTLKKSIAVAAGLGGGSADAAATLALAAGVCGVAADQLPGLALQLGADVPFCLTGGLALLEGRGERVGALPPSEPFAIGIVVPDVELSTASVYRQWDQMGEPQGRGFPTAALPPGLRGYDPLRNDLQPAAEALAPQLADWRADLAARWGRPVTMTGSGPALFGFFVDADEAHAAVADRPGRARAARAVSPVPRGWRKVTGTLTDPEQWGVV